MFNFRKSIKNLANTDNEIIMIIYDYKPKTETEYDNKKREVSILDETRKFLVDFNIHHGTIFKLNGTYQLQKLDKVLSNSLCNNGSDY